VRMNPAENLLIADHIKKPAKPSTREQLHDFDLSRLDSIQSLTVFYAVFKNISMSSLSPEVRARIDAKFRELIGRMQDSVSRRGDFMTNISDSSFVTEDIRNLLNHATRESEALDINEAGDIVGWSRGPRGTRAVMWSRAGLRELGGLPGASHSRARAINARGEVVGDSGGDHEGRAFLWTRAAGLQDLNTLLAQAAPFELVEAVAINDQGQIIALGRERGHGHHGAHRNGRAVPTRVFLLDPAR